MPSARGMTGCRGGRRSASGRPGQASGMSSGSGKCTRFISVIVFACQDIFPKCSRCRRCNNFIKRNIPAVVHLSDFKVQSGSDLPDISFAVFENQISIFRGIIGVRCFLYSGFSTILVKFRPLLIHHLNIVLPLSLKYRVQILVAFWWLKKLKRPILK